MPVGFIHRNVPGEPFLRGRSGGSLLFLAASNGFCHMPLINAPLDPPHPPPIVELATNVRPAVSSDFLSVF